MKFSIIAYKYLPGLDDTYRLRKDNSWINQEDFTALDSEGDKIFNTFEEAQAWLDHTGPVLINGVPSNTIEKEDKNLVSPDYSFLIITHRFTKPINPIPTREQLRDTIAKGNDNYTNVLVIDYDGAIRLIPLTDRSAVSVQGFPVRYESFQAGNGYVGYKASSDGIHIEDTFMALLEAWCLHLKTGRSMYRDYTSGDLTEQELMDEINLTLNKID